MDDRIKVLISEDEIKSRVAELAVAINADYRGKALKLICVLSGAVLFMADLVKRLEMDVQIDFIHASSYGAETKSSGIVKITHDLKTPITGEHVLLVEDIVDSGNSIHRLKKHLLEQKPDSLKVCTMLDKPERREIPGITPEYIGFSIPNEFVIGYGLDYNQRYRHLPFVGVLPKELI